MVRRRRADPMRFLFELAVFGVIASIAFAVVFGLTWAVGSPFGLDGKRAALFAAVFLCFVVGGGGGGRRGPRRGPRVGVGGRGPPRARGGVGGGVRPPPPPPRPTNHALACAGRTRPAQTSLALVEAARGHAPVAM